jgi:hypothetical protein
LFWFVQRDIFGRFIAIAQPRDQTVMNQNAKHNLNFIYRLQDYLNSRGVCTKSMKITFLDKYARNE